jgi:hypothetical protein
VDALKSIPDTDIRLKLRQGDALHQKTDIFQNIMWYSYVNDPGNFIPVPVEKVKFIIDENRKGNFPEKLEEFTKIIEKKTTFESGVVQDDLTRFDNL